MAQAPPEYLGRDRSASHGDSELAEHERKRPRLDMQQNRDLVLTENGGRTMMQPSDAIVATSSLAPHNPSRLTTPPTMPALKDGHQSTRSPTSKVTINTRPMSAQSLTHDTSHINRADDEDNTRTSNDLASGSESPTVVSISDADSSKTLPGGIGQPISIPSSPSKSPTAQVESQEDPSDSTQPSDWPVTDEHGLADTVQFDDRPLWYGFPFQGSASQDDVIDTLRSIGQVFERGGDESQFAVLLQGMTPFILEMSKMLRVREFASLRKDIEFCQALPILMSCLLKRRTPLPPDVSESELLQFMQAFAHVSMSAIQADILRLKSLENSSSLTDPPWLLYSEYLQRVATALQLPSSYGLHTALRTSRQVNWTEFPARLITTFLIEDLTTPFDLLSNLFNEIARTVPPNSQLRASMLAIIQYYRTFLSAINIHKALINTKQRDALRKGTFEFVSKAHEALQEAIIKQHTWLTIENNGECVQIYTYLTKVTVLLFPDLAEEVFKMAKISVDPVEPDEVVELAAQAFRLALLKTLIQQGRMELRVWATETMAQELVNVWASFQRLPSYRSQPMLKLVIDFLSNNHVVKYILGVDSHPQIVSRSFNVIGFLCVSNNWHPQDSDVAWQAILEGQDHRSVAAVIEALKLNLQHLCLDASLYMYEKVHAIPAEQFDNRMLDFTVTLLGYTTQKYGRSHDREHQVNLTMIELCLHLLKEANVPSRCSTEIAKQIREEIGNFLLVNQPSSTGSWYLDMTDDEKENIRSTICNNVASHSDHATGSVMGMRTILHTLDKLAAGELVAKCDYAKLLLNDMVHLSEDYKRDVYESEDALFIQFMVRIDCMFHLVLHVPQSFDDEMLHSLWHNVLAATLPPRIESYAWTMIANAYRNSAGANSVLEFVASCFMQSLKPSSFNTAILDFAQASVEHDIRTNLGRMSEVDQCLEVPSMERLWKIMLEAPDQTVEVQASNLIIKMYLDKSLLSRSSAVSVEKSQASLVDRCIRTVIDSAQQLGASNSNATAVLSQDGSLPTETDMDKHEVQLHRSLMLLRSFLDTLKTKSHFKIAPSQIIGPALRTFQRRGPAIALRLRILDHPEIRSETVSWVVGEENTGHELWQFLTSTTGWSHVNFIIGGGRMQLHDSQLTVRDLKIGPGAVIVNKAIGSTETGVNRALRCTSPVDSKIMHHFGELYALLESQERIAKAIYEFLTMFSSQEDIVTEIKSRSLPAASILPIEKPFKLLYYATALRSCIEEESYSSEPNMEFLQYTVQTIIAALGHIQSIHTDSQLFTAILHGITETLLLALRAKVPESTSSTYFSDPASFIANLVRSWRLVQSIKSEQVERINQRALFRNFFDIFIEVTLHQSDSWQFIDQHEDFDDLFASALLFEPDRDGRQNIRDVILRLTGTSIGKIAVKAEDTRSPRGRFPLLRIEDCLSHLWMHMYPLLPRAVEVAATCREFLEAAVAIFGNVSKKLEGDVLMSNFVDVRSLLLKQDYTSRNRISACEYLPQGLAKLLYYCISGIVRLDIHVPDSNELIRDIYRRFLFPPLSESSEASLATQKAPVIETSTRTALYEVIIALCRCEESLKIVTEEVAESAVDREAFSHHTSNERTALRSDQGYAGLRNLSNTCYLNSLFSQLFMNVRFREFIIGINIANESEQKLICELANVFANMQSSYEKYVSPEEAVESIIQYTGEQIDVTVQMDVDEFFNLLFDRLEAQIKDADAREVFKSIYGGQLVQQIKSQECEHISERLEPFSAVQIEIKGKSGLEEGLAAYVEGEVLQGENKYSCTGCGRHVNAVKRACLKEVPDNLIFNLKRFDYDIMTGMRCKVNDEFQFPDKIDMMPYTMDALSNPDHKLPPDLFELVGVIIHSGTAETGHYYSYIRQRPSILPNEDSWVQFNDQDVSKFEPGQMRDMAFGGCDQTFNALSKFYNGYMLFYQRASSVAAYAQDYPIFDEAGQVEVALPRGLDNRIAQENEICFRRYVAQDPSHAKFIRQLCERMRLGEEKCSAPHSLEDNLIPTVLEYVHQVSSRWKEAPDFEETIKVISEYVKSCPRCALNVVEWFDMDDNVVSCILRAWYTQARRQFASLLATCYTILSPLRYAAKKDDGPPIARRRLDELYSNCLKHITQNWMQIQRWNRGWEQLFGFLLAVAQLGYREAHTLIELELLERCLEIIWVHNTPNSKATWKNIRSRYANYLLAKEKGRQFHHVFVMDLFAELLQYVSLDEEHTTPGYPAINLNETENELLGLSPTGSFVWLKKLIAGRNSDSAVESVVKELCRYPALLQKTAEVLLNGLLSTKSSVQAAFLFLAPCQHYIRYCSDDDLVSDMIKRSLTAVSDSDGLLGSCFLDYIKEILALETTASGCNHQMIEQLVVNGVGGWAPPLLMAPNDVHRDVRTETLTLLDEILFAPLTQLDDVETVRTSLANVEILRSLVCESITYLNKNFLSVNTGMQQQRNVLFVGQGRQMIRVLEYCESFFDSSIPEDGQLITLVQGTIEELQLLEANIDTEELEGWRDPSSDQLSDQSFEMSLTP